MIDYTAIAQRKENVASRLIAALYRIKGQNIPRLEQRVLENLAVCVTPSRAYDSDRDSYLPFGRPIRPRTRQESKKAAVFHTAHLAVIAYWELIRTDEAIGLDRLVERLEYIAANGYKNCEIIGSEAGGYELFLVPVGETK